MDSLPARDYARIPLIESFHATYDFDLFGVCESFLSNSISNSDIQINGFSPDPLRADKLPNVRNGGVCLYYKENLPIKERTDLQIIPETIVAEIKFKRKKIFFILSYCHPNLPIEVFNDYISAMEKILISIRKENPTMIILTGDYNAKSPLFLEHDPDTREGRIMSDLLLSNNFEELINEPTHLRDSGSQSCIDLICTDQPHYFTNSGVMPSLDSHSKHSIIHGTLNFHIPIPPPYKRKVWDYKAAKVDLIRKDLTDTNWHDLFLDLNVHEMSLIFSDVLMNTFSKYIPNRTVICNDRDAPWVTPALKTAIKRNTRVYKKWVQRGRKEEDHDNVRKIQNETNKLIKDAKHSYYKKLGDTLSDPLTGANVFWKAFKRFSNKSKMSNIPPLLDNNTYVTNFQTKANMFNNYFADQCTILDNDSALPQNLFKTNEKISDIQITNEMITNIIMKFNAKKAGGYDGISITMLQLCAAEISIPLRLIYEACISTGLFPDPWKYANVQPVHKKNNRQLVSNYRPISLLPIFGKILEKIVFDQVYSFLARNNLLSKNQSGFRPGDSTIYQLLSITSTIYESLENFDKTRAVFLDISKAFDKVWHDGVIFKLKCNGISGNLLNFFQNYLQNRFQRVVLNGTESDWKELKAGVPQGSVLGPLLFLIYINDLAENMNAEMRLFADDSSLFSRVKGIEETHNMLVDDLETVSKWAVQWKMTFNPDLTKQAIEVVFSAKKNKPEHPNLSLNDIPVAKKDDTKHLGVYLDSALNFSKHVREAVLKAHKGLSLLRFLSRYVSRRVIDLCYKLYVSVLI